MIGAAVAQALKDAAYAVDWVRDGDSALDAAECGDYAIMILDLGLPKQDGITVLERMRFRNNTMAVLIVTARDSLDDRIRGLDLGADDYLVKPFEVRELLARMRAVTRRQHGQAVSVLTNGILKLDPATKEACCGERVCRLSAREFALLQALLIRPGAILSRQDLETRIYGWNEEVESNAIDFLIYGVRKKLGNDVIRNVRGLGWMVDKQP